MTVVSTPAFKLAGRGAAPQPVRVNQSQPGPAGSRLRDVADRGRVHRPVWAVNAEEHLPVAGLGPAVLQIRHDGAPRVPGQRKPLVPGALARDDDLATPPVNVIQPQGGDPTDPQAQAGQQRQDGQVAPSRRSGLVARREHGRDLPPGQRLGQPGQPPRPGRRHRVGQPGADSAVDVQEPQQRTERGHRRRQRGRAEPGFPDDERGHLLSGQGPQVQAAAVLQSRQERADELRPPGDRRLRETSSPAR